MNHDDLDQQIRAALDMGELPPLDPLKRYWHQLSSAQRRRQRFCRVATLGGALLAATATALWCWWPEATAPSLNDDSPRLAQPAAAGRLPGQSPAVAHRPTPPRQAPASAGRPPTLYERVWFLAQTRETTRVGLAATVGQIDAMIEQLLRDSSCDPPRLVESSGLETSQMERVLLGRLITSSDEHRHVVLRLLAICGSSRAVPHLLRLARRNVFRDEALATVEQIVGTQGLAKLCVQSRDRATRAALLRRLLAGPREPAWRVYLALVENPATRDEALAVARSVDQPVWATLLRLLDDEDVRVRTSAALTLGYINGPEVTAALIALVGQEAPCRDEVWMALLACRSRQARQFVADASGNPRLLGQLNRARVRWAQMLPQPL